MKTLSSKLIISFSESLISKTLIDYALNTNPKPSNLKTSQEIQCKDISKSKQEQGQGFVFAIIIKVLS